MARQEASTGTSALRRMEEIVGRQGLPANLEAERALLGAVLINNALLEEVQVALRPEDMASPAHARILTALRDLRQESIALDTVTLAERLTRSGELEAVGGAEYVTDLITGMPRLTSCEHYIKIIKDRSLLRQLISRANQIALDAYTSGEEPEEILARAERSILEVGDRALQSTLSGMPELAARAYETLETLMKREGHVTGVSTGFVYLDDMTSGLQPSDLVILAARPSVGKTAFALSLALNAARHGKTTAFFSLEMSAEQIFFRLLSMETRINLQKLRTGKFPRNQLTEVVMHFGALRELPLFVDDSPLVNLLDLGAKLRRLKTQRGLDLVVVDYLQLMRGVGKHENRNQEVSAISRGLKALSKELKVPLVALSQLSRAPEKRGEGKEPILSDLRDSGSIEQDADLVMFLHRSLSASASDPASRGRARLLIAKQRNGPTGSIDLTFLENQAQFANLHPGLSEGEAGD